MPVPNTFANATATIPLSQLDANFATTITLGNTAIQLGNTVSTLNNMTLANVTVTSGNVTITNVTVTTANVTTANIATANVTTSQILNYGTANSVQYLNTSKALTSDANFAYTATGLGIGTSSPAEKLDVVGTYIQAADTRTNNTNKLFGLRMPHYANATAAVNLIGAVSTSGGNALYIGGNDTSFAGTAATSILFYTAATGSVASGTQRMAIDSSGNLGLGVTPNALVGLSSYRTFDIGTGAGNGLLGGPNDVQVVANAYYNSGWKYAANGASTRYASNAGTHLWYNAPSGTAGNTITFTQAMTLDANGNLGVGDTTPEFNTGYKNISISGSTGSMVDFRVGDGNGLRIQTQAASSQIINIANIPLAFHTNDTERARITSGGFFLAQGNSSYSNSAASFHEFVSATNNTATCQIRSKATNGQQYGLAILTNNDQNDAARYFLTCLGGATERATLRANGGLANYSANNVNLASDQRLKKDISLLDTSWDKVKQIEVVNFRYKDCNEGDPLLYGVIAQQVQPIVPELVVVTQEAKEATEDTEATPEYFGIREQPMYWLAIKALQEAMTRIEALEAEVQALKGNA